MMGRGAVTDGGEAVTYGKGAVSVLLMMVKMLLHIFIKSEKIPLAF